MISVWLLIPALFVGTIIGAFLTIVCIGAWKETNTKKKWLEDE